jgi:arginyl-tRNA synthetase
MEAMTDPLVLLHDRLTPAFEQVAGRAADPVVRTSDRADAQANGALALAKELGRPPRDVAADIVAAAHLDDLCEVVEIAGPGFINLTLRDGVVSDELAKLAVDDRLGVRRAPVIEKVVVDYSAPNVAKEMHVGHLRSTVIGDALVRLLAFAGHDVVRENHIGDWGTPFGMLIEHLLDIDPTGSAANVDVHDLDGFYKAARAKFDASEEFQERSRRRVVLLQGGDPATLALWRTLVERSTEYFNEVYAKLGVLLTDDDLAGESGYQTVMGDVLQRLDAAGLVTESDGARVVFPAGFTNRDGDPLPLIVEKAGGGFNYATSDLACVADRVERIGATLILYVVGAPQAQHFQMVFSVARAMGWLSDRVRAEHVAFGNVLGPDRKMLKSRSGDAVRLVELLDEGYQRAEAAVREKNPDLGEEERAAVAQAVGIGAVKYADLSNDRIKDYVFDWDQMLSFDGNTGPYLQYAHARIRSIFRRAEVDPADVRGVAPLIGAPQERDLAFALLSFDRAVWDALDTLSPHKLCTHLFDLASRFTAFYEACPVLRAETEELRASRLALCDLTARVLATGLGLLGIDAPDRM